MSDPTKYQSSNPIRFESVSSVTSTPSVRPGTRVTVDGNDYVYVYNTSNSQISVGRGAIVSAVTGYSVTASSLASQMAGLMGVCKNATLTTGTYGWLLTKGFSNAHTVDAAAIGDSLALGADGAFENKSGITGPAYGKAMSALASGTATGPAYFSIY